MPPDFKQGEAVSKRNTLEIVEINVFRNELLNFGSRGEVSTVQAFGFQGNGECKIARRDVVTMAQMPQSQLQKLEGELKVQEQRGFVPYMETRARLNEPPRPKIHPAIKNMPEFDPDADVNGLALTVPTWTNSIEKTRSKANLSEISERARKGLQVVLVDLRATINTLLEAMEDEE